MKWEGEVVAVKDRGFPHASYAVTLSGTHGHPGVVELSVPRQQIGAYAIGRRVAVTVNPR